MTHFFSHFSWLVCYKFWYIRGLWCQKQVSQAEISNCIPQFSVGCNYLSMPDIPASYTKVLICAYTDQIPTKVICGIKSLCPLGLFQKSTTLPFFSAAICWRWSQVISQCFPWTDSTANFRLLIFHWFLSTSISSWDIMMKDGLLCVDLYFLGIQCIGAVLLLLYSQTR